MLAALALALVVTAASPPPGADADPATPTLDVVVADARGRSPDTLKAADFRIVQSGTPATIDSLTFVRGETRVVGILLDDFHVTPGPAALRVRDALVRFVRDDLRPGDLVAILRPLDSLLTISATTDREVAIHAIEAFDPRRGDYAPRSAFEREFIAGTPARIEGVRAQIVAASLNALTTQLGRFGQTRKTLLLISDGAPELTNRRGTDGPGLAAVVDTANRAHVAIYPISPSPLDGRDAGASPAAPSSSPVGSRDVLRSLATDTGGRVSWGDDAVTQALGRALADASGYYVLGLSAPGEASTPGGHLVVVATSRPDLTLTTRKGYWVPPSDTLAVSHPSSSALFSSSFSSKIQRHASPLIRSWFGMTKGPGGETRVSFVWEPVARVPGDRSRLPLPTRIALSVKTLDGAPVYDGVVMASLGAADGAASQPSQASFDSPAGRLLVQMDIEDDAAHVVDRDVRDLVVGGFPGPVTLGTSEVLRARTARERDALAADPDASPVAARQFSRREHLLIRVPVFSAGPTPVVSARLVSGLGGAMRDLAVEATPSRAGVYQIDLPLSVLPSGSYVLEISARTTDGEARDSLAFRVTP